MKGWTTEKMPRLDGKVVVVTGANSGIGFEAARGFADAGAHVVFACRNQDKAQDALQQLRSDIGDDASAEFMRLDLASLASVEDFAGALRDKFDRLDRLVNNAGVMVPPFSRTEDGFELQFGVNHLGHFALTGQLLDLLLDTDESRVVTVSSMAHRIGWMNLDDPNWERRRYNAWLAYGQSKLANLLFTHELQRKLQTADTDSVATAAHPGWSATSLQRHSLAGKTGNSFFAQPAHAGAWPTMAAAVAPVDGGEYFGPGGFLEIAGPAKRVGSNTRARDKAAAARLWELSEELTGVRYDFDDPVARAA
jgi:NAD(P)-dependent dehydrogenase (short-subunit alcohol dehydrogenase family)